MFWRELHYELPLSIPDDAVGRAETVIVFDHDQLHDVTGIRISRRSACFGLNRNDLPILFQQKIRASFEAVAMRDEQLPTPFLHVLIDRFAFWHMQPSSFLLT